MQRPRKVSASFGLTHAERVFLLSLTCFFVILGFVWFWMHFEEDIKNIELTFLKGAVAEQGARVEEEERERNENQTQTQTVRDITLLESLKSRLNEIQERERRVAEREREVERRQKSIAKQLEKIEKVRKDIETRLKDRISADAERVDRLVEFYSTMKPDQAAEVLEDLNVELTVQILEGMKRNNAAEIMNNMSTQRARLLTEILAGYRRSPSNTGD